MLIEDVDRREGFKLEDAESKINLLSHKLKMTEEAYQSLRMQLEQLQQD